MGRRTYHIKPHSKKESKKLREDALSELRKVRETIDPEILARTKAILEDAAEGAGAEHVNADIDMPEQSDSEALIPLDKEKTVDTVKQFLKLKADNPDFTKKLHTLLVD